MNNLVAWKELGKPDDPLTELERRCDFIAICIYSLWDDTGRNNINNVNEYPGFRERRTYSKFGE